MSSQHARTKASDNQCNSEIIGRGLGGVEGESRKDGDESNKVLNSNSAWRDIGREESFSRESSSLGGIFRQLRELRESHLASVEENEKKLREGLTKNENHKQDLLQSIEKLENLLEQLIETE